jgi:fructose-1-phosphate kinase PfkB-like protein
MSDAEAFRWGMAASAAALLSPGTPLCQWHDCQRLLPDVTVQDC